MIFILISSVLGTCDPGFIGQHCNIVCRYPSFGQGCQHHCNCDKMYCDFKTGCEGKALVIIFVFSASFPKKSLNEMGVTTNDIRICGINFDLTNM